VHATWRDDSWQSLSSARSFIHLQPSKRPTKRSHLCTPDPSTDSRSTLSCYVTEASGRLDVTLRRCVSASRRFELTYCLHPQWKSGTQEINKNKNKRRDRVSAQLHFNICKETAVQLDKTRWYQHVPKSVETSRGGKVTIPWKQQVQNDHPQ
jgi:hypothetical protein